MGYRKAVCEWCGKEFRTKSDSRKLCSKKCRMEKKDSTSGGQLCWNCQRATGKCEWSKHLLKPVKGSCAEPVYKKEDDGYTRRTYKITFCPQFLPDQRRAMV